MSGCAIYIIELSLLQPLLLVFQVYRELPPRQSVTGLANSEFGHEDLMLDQFWPASTGVHVLVGVIHWGSELWGASAEFGSATSHIFFCKDVMDGPPHTQASKWAFRPCLHTRSWKIWQWKRHNVDSNILQPQRKTKQFLENSCVCFVRRGLHISWYNLLSNPIVYVQ